MGTRVATTGGDRRRLLACLGLPALLAGCQAAPARLAGLDDNPPRPVALARQFAADSAVELATRPVRTSRAFAADVADVTWAAAEGLAGKRLLLALRETPPPVPPERPLLDAAALEADLRRATGRKLCPAHVELQHDGAQSLAVLERLIDGATHTLDVLMFMWEGDEVGQSLAERLAARARQGVTVRVLVDGGGNLIYGKPAGATTAEVNRAVCWLARQPGVQVIRARNGYYRFDHRKLLLADGRTAWSGGRNFNVNSFFQQNDTSFTVTGPLVAELREEFERSWEDQGGAVVRGPWSTVREQKGEPTATNALARLVTNGPARHDFRDTVFSAIDRARHHIYLENPYLCDPRVVLRLAHARRRGVDVRVVLTFDTTTPIFGEASKLTANRLLHAGVRVYVRPGMTHLKALSVDGCWAYIGTGNFDALSLRADAELGLGISAGSLVRDVEEELLQPDFRPEWELLRPVPVSVKDRLAEIAASFVL